MANYYSQIRRHRGLIIFLMITFVSVVDRSTAQDLLEELEQNLSEEPSIVTQTFKGTRVVNGHSVESKGGGELEFIFAHRFGPVNSGISQLFGLDDAYVRLGLDYGMTDQLSVSIGRNSVDKTIDGYLKYKVARQRSGADYFPVTITALAGTAYKATPASAGLPDGYKGIDKLAYVAQLIIARKLNPRLSLQASPTFVHKNAVDQSLEKNDQSALGLAGRYKLTKSLALTGEYYYRFGVRETDRYFNTLGFGLDIETGGHVFQLVFTNTRGITERAFITETEGSFSGGDIHFGFNVTRNFQLRRKK